MTFLFSLLFILFIVTVFVIVTGSKDGRFFSIGVILLFTLLSFGSLSAGYSSLTRDVETWGGWVTETRYYEDWNEYIHRTCTRTVGSGKNQRTITYDCSYVQYHPEVYVIYGSNGEEIEVNEQDYLELKSKFKNSKFVDMHRHYHSNDGDMYSSKYNGEENALTPIFTEHIFENRTLGNEGVFKYSNVDKVGLYDRFIYSGWANSSAVYGRYKNSEDADKFLQHFNSKFGRLKELRINLLLFTGDLSLGENQEAFWKGGKKNEFNLCVGIKNGKVSWVHHFCFSPDGYAGNDEIGIEMREFIGKDADILEIAKTLSDKCVKKWKRKSFEEFEYLEVRYPTWSYVVISILFGVSCITCVFLKEFDTNELQRNRTKRYR